MIIYCCCCKSETDAELVTGREIYPGRDDLGYIPFWKCKVCSNYVGCHYKTNDAVKPLGCIPTDELRKARRAIHEILDPLWKPDRDKRKEVYKALSKLLGYDYHSAEVRTIDEARNIYRTIKGLSGQGGQSA